MHLLLRSKFDIITGAVAGAEEHLLVEDTWWLQPIVMVRCTKATLGKLADKFETKVYLS